MSSMIRPATLFVALLALTGCEKASAKAEQEAAMVEKTGDEAATCAAKRKVADAYLSEGNEAEYKTAKLYADTSCLSYQLRRQNGVVL